MSDHPYCPDDTFTGSPGAGRHDYDPRDYVTHQVLAQNLVELRKISSALASLAGAPATTNAILQRLAQLETNIMAKISEYLAQQRTHNEAVHKALTDITTSITEVDADINELNAKITALQNAPGEFNPADQAAADVIQADALALSERLSTAVTALQAVNAKTPPAVPTVPPNQ